MMTTSSHWRVRSGLTTLVLATIGIFSSAANADTSFPDRAVTLIVPYPAGGATDVVARFLGAKLQQRLGQSVLIQNRPGASGMVGAQHVAKSPADGYTVLVGVTSMIQLPAMMDDLPVDPLKDFTPVVLTAHTSNLFLVPLDSPAKTIQEFVELAKKNPDTYNFASWGPGSSAHIHGELLNQQAGLDLTHVPFQGSAPVMTNLIGGQITSAFVDIPSATPHLKSVRPLAVTGPMRLPDLPEVPTFTELGYQSFDARGWHGMFVPAGTPKPVVMKLSSELNQILTEPDTEARIKSLGMIRGGGTPEAFAEAMHKDTAVYEAIIKAADIKL